MDEDAAYKAGKQYMAATVLRLCEQPDATLDTLREAVAGIYGEGPDENVAKLVDVEVAAISVKVLGAKRD